jgi:hypothetical protein
LLLRSVNLMVSHFLKHFRDRIRDQMIQRPDDARIISTIDVDLKQVFSLSPALAALLPALAVLTNSFLLRSRAD